MPYDLFISYSRRDNAQGRVTQLKERIEADYRAFAGTDLRCFFDIQDIQGMEDWRHKILQGLRESSLFLLVLSPNYLASEYCGWEVVEYLKYEFARAAQGQGIAPVYFVTIPGLDTPDFEKQAAAWVAGVRRRNHFDLRPWYDEGAEALKKQDVRARLEALEKTLHERLHRLKRLAEAPGNLPAGNPRFVGREVEMKRLHEAAALGKVGVLATVHGVGGLGKTALALQYACAYADFYPGGRWLIGCTGQTSLAATLTQLNTPLGVQFTDEERADVKRGAERILRELEDRARSGAAARAGEKDPPAPRALVILDNVDSPALLQPPESDLVTGKPWLSILATTRLGEADFGADDLRHALVAVDELPPGDALSLIESYQPRGQFPTDAERAAAQEIVKLLGGFTLAVEDAAVYLGECGGRVTCAAFLERLKNEGLTGLEAAASKTKGGIAHGEKLVSATLSPTLDLLAPEETLVLEYASLLAPDCIAVPWLRALAARDHPDLGRDAEPGYDDPWLSLLNHLIGLRILQVLDYAPDSRTPRIVRMHRMAQAVVRWRMAEESPGVHQAAVDSLVETRAEALSKTTNWTRQRWEIEPLAALAELWAETHHSRAARLLNEAAMRLHDLAEWARAEPLIRRALAIDEKSHGPDSPDVARDLHNLACLLRDTNRLAESEPLMRHALAIDEKCYGPDHRDVAIHLNILALLLQATNRLAEAEPLMRRALAIGEKCYGPDHPDVAVHLNSLALLLQNTNRLAEAEPLVRRALAIDEKSYGADHPIVATALNNLAEVLRDTNRLTEAEPLMRRALAIDEKSYGPDHPKVAIHLSNLAQVLRHTNRRAEAEPLMRRALAINEKSYGPDHPNVANCLNNLAQLLQDTNRFGEAEPLMRRVLGIFERSLGRDHPNVAVALSNLARLLQDTNRLAEAEPLMRRHLVIFINSTRAIGHRHPLLLAAANNYLRLLLAMGVPKAEAVARTVQIAPDLFGGGGGERTA